MNTESTRLFNSIEKQFGSETAEVLTSFVKELGTEIAEQKINDKTKDLATKQDIANIMSDFKIEMTNIVSDFKMEMTTTKNDLKLEIAKQSISILRWTILLWVAQLGALAGIIKMLVH